MDELLKKNLIKELGLTTLSGEKQEEIFAQVGTIILEGTLSRVIPMLSNEEKAEFEKIVDEPGDNNSATLFAFLKETIPNFEQIVNEEIAELKKDSFDVLSKIG